MLLLGLSCYQADMWGNTGGFIPGGSGVIFSEAAGRVLKGGGSSFIHISSMHLFVHHVFIEGLLVHTVI